MKANNLNDSSNNSTDKVEPKKKPNTMKYQPYSDEFLFALVRKAFPKPKANPELTATILKKIRENS